MEECIHRTRAYQGGITLEWKKVVKSEMEFGHGYILPFLFQNKEHVNYNVIF
jgi:hypothetical protein